MDIDDAMARNKPKLDGPSEAHTEEQREIVRREIAVESSKMRAGLGAEPDPLAAELPGVQLPRVELLGVNALEVGEGQRAGPRRRRSTVFATAAVVLVVGGLLASVWYSTNRSNSTSDVIAASPPVETSASVTTSAPVEASPVDSAPTDELEVMATTSSLVPSPSVLPPPLELWANDWINFTGLMRNFENDEVNMNRIDEACSVDLSDRDVNDDLARTYIEADGGDVADPDLVLRAAQSIWLSARNICPLQFPRDVIDAGPPGDFGSLPEELEAARLVDDAIRAAVVVSTDGPLVVGSVAITLLPSIVACDAAGLPNYGAKIRDSVRYETAAAVLEELVSRTDLDVGIPLPQHGYLEMQFGDGSMFYGTSGFENVFGVLVHAIPFDDGWALESWKTSGC